MGDVTVRTAIASDRDGAVSALTDAFAADPIWGWMTRSDPPPPGRLRLFFETIVEGELQKGAETAYVAGAGAGASIWRDVGDKGPSNWEILKSTPTFVRVFRSGLGRTLRAVSAIDKAHPKELHAYLFFVGVHQNHRGHGLGAALLTPMLERCDTEGIPAYLENSNPINGFRAARKYRSPEGGAAADADVARTTNRVSGQIASSMIRFSRLSSTSPPTISLVPSVCTTTTAG